MEEQLNESQYNEEMQEMRTKFDEELKNTRHKFDEQVQNLRYQVGEYRMQYNNSIKANEQKYVAEIHSIVKKAGKGLLNMNSMIEHIITECNKESMKEIIARLSLLQHNIVELQQDIGIKMTDTKIGDNYDTSKHKILSMEAASEDKPANTIAEIKRQGFMYKDYLLVNDEVIVYN